MKEQAQSRLINLEVCDNTAFAFKGWEILREIRMAWEWSGNGNFLLRVLLAVQDCKQDSIWALED